MPAPLITAVMQRSMQSYLEREVRIPSGAPEYSRDLIDQGYETPELFHQISDEDLKKKFKWKDGHIKALNLYVKAHPEVKIPKKGKKAAPKPKPKQSKKKKAAAPPKPKQPKQPKQPRQQQGKRDQSHLTPHQKAIRQIQQQWKFFELLSPQVRRCSLAILRLNGFVVL